MQPLLMFCPNCGAEYSAHYGDYSFWGLNGDKPFTCEECEADMVLMERYSHTHLGVATINRMGEYQRDPQGFKREYLEAEAAALREF